MSIRTGGHWKRAAAIAAAVMLGYLVWGVGVGPRRLRIEHHVVQIPHLPACFEGARIALLSDVQVGMPLGNEGVAAEAVRHIVRCRPAAVLLAGDFVLHPQAGASERLATVVELLRPLAEGGLQVFAVLGNHDYQQDSDAPRTPRLEVQVAEALTGIGFKVLRNEVAAIDPPSPRADGQRLFVVGLSEHRMGDDRVAQALAGLPPDAARVVMMHNPDTFPHLPAGAAPFAVAGHTHGAQVSLVPGTARPWWMRVAGMPEDVPRGSGWADPAFGRPGNRLYITRGIGFSHAPVRINAPPELTLFHLRQVNPSSATRTSAQPTSGRLTPGVLDGCLWLPVDLPADVCDASMTGIRQHIDNCGQLLRAWAQVAALSRELDWMSRLS